MLDTTISRRGALRAVAAAGAAAVGPGVAAAEEGPRARIVGTDSPRAERAAKQRAAHVQTVLDFEHIGKAVVGRFSDQAAANLSKRADVRYVEHNGTMEKLAETLPWGIDRVDADVVHADGGTGAGATVAVLDTGIDDDHPDLQANVVGGKAFETECGAESGGCRFGAEGYNGNDCNHTWSDDDDHGSHVSGSADGVDNSRGVIGVATGADLLAGKVLTGCGSGTYSAIASGITWATDQGADVINMSLGADSGSSTLQDACQYAYDNNVVVVAAAGNSGPCSDCVGYPAAYDTVVAVSATTPSDTLAGYSSTGPEVEIAAPGGANDGNDSTSILSTIPPESDSDGEGYAYFVGTSMATPHVAGAAALVKAETSLSDNQQIIDRLKSTAEDIGLADNEGGAGLLDAEAAVGSSSGGDSAPSVSWVTPADGDTVSGTITVQIDAADSEDGDGSLNVDWLLGSSSRDTTYDSTSGYYEDSWDTTTSADGSYDLTAEATDSAGNTTTTTITVSVDNTESAPVVDSLSASEVETSDSDAEFDADWAVSDADGDLSSVDLTLTDDTDGETEDTATVSVSGDTASGTTRLVAAGDDGSGNSYTVDVTVTDGSGATASDATSVAETEDTGSAPTIDSFAVSTRTTGPWFRVESSWSVSDADGDLASVTTELLDASGNVLDSEESSVGGSSASGSHETRTRSSAAEVRLTVTDASGNSSSSTKSV